MMWRWFYWIKLYSITVIVVAFICGTGRSANGQDSECINPVWNDSGIVRQSVDGQGSMDVYWFYASGVSASVSLI